MELEPEWAPIQRIARTAATMPDQAKPVVIITVGVGVTKLKYFPIAFAMTFPIPNATNVLNLDRR